MSAEAVSLEELQVVPDVKQISALDGVTELSEDVRLVTSNVLPLQRKAMRSIFSGAGIRVVANKKKFVIDIKVLDFEEFDLSDVPADGQADYYEVDIRDNVVTVRTPSQAGALWGCMTFGWIYRGIGKDRVIPNLTIRDWSVIPVRGVMIEGGRGGVLMEQDAWFELMTRMNAGKLNHLAIRLWGHNGSEYNTDERLLVSLDEDAEMKSESACKWFSPRDGEWCSDSIIPKLAETEKLADLVVYACEREITMAPYVDLLGRGTPFARLKAGLSAVGSDGKPTGMCLCPSNPEARQFVESLIASVFERYFPTGVKAFHLDVSNLGDEPICLCDECKGSSNKELVDGLIAWFTDMLKEKGVSSVYCWENGTSVIHGSDAAIEQAFRRTLDHASREGVVDGEKAVFASVEDYDPGWSNRLSEFALSMWTGCEDVTEEKLEDGQWARLVLGASCEEPYREAAGKLTQAALSFSSASGVCLEACCEGETPCTLNPQRLLADVAKTDEHVAQFSAAKEAALSAADLLKPLSKDKEVCRDVDFVKSLIADAETIAGLSVYFQAMCNGGDKDQAREGILQALSGIQDYKPRWIVPFQLTEFSPFVECID